MPQLLFQSPYDQHGTLTQYFDGLHTQPNMRKMVVVQSNTNEEREQHTQEGVPFADLKPEGLLGSTISVQGKKWLVYHSNSTSGELALGYFVVTGSLPETPENLTVVLLFPRSRNILAGTRFALIGEPESTIHSVRRHPLRDEPYDAIDRVETYDFPENAQLGFVLFPRCWHEATGFTADWSRALWSEPKWNVVTHTEGLRAFPTNYYMTYVRDPALLLPVTSKVQYVGVEDTRSDWHSDNDFHDLGFSIIDGGQMIPLEGNLNAGVRIPNDPKSGGLACSETKIVVGIPETQSVQIFNVSNTSLANTISSEQPFFGCCVAIANETVAVGSATHVNIYLANESILGKQTIPMELITSIATEGDKFAMDASGKRVVIYAGIYISVFDNGVRTAELVAPYAVNSISVSGDGLVIVIGCPGVNVNTGKVFYFTSSGDAWSEANEIVFEAESPNAQFGFAVAADYDASRIVASAPSTNTRDADLVVFTKSETGYGVETVLHSHDPFPMITKFFHGRYVTIAQDVIAQVNQDYYADLTWTTTLEIYKFLDGEWRIVQNSPEVAIESPSWFVSSKFALSPSGKFGVRRVLGNHMTDLGQIAIL